MTVQGAKKCFAENINLFASPQAQPEKYNLYNGLLGLADGIETLQSEIYQLRQDLQMVLRTKGIQR